MRYTLVLLSLLCSTWVVAQGPPVGGSVSPGTIPVGGPPGPGNRSTLTNSNVTTDGSTVTVNGAVNVTGAAGTTNVNSVTAGSGTFQADFGGVVGNDTATNNDPVNDPFTVGVIGTSASLNGGGVEGIANLVGVYARARGDSGTAVDARANSLTGSTLGIRAVVRSPNGIGIFANPASDSFDPSAGTVGVWARTRTKNGIAVYGEALQPGVANPATDCWQGFFNCRNAGVKGVNRNVQGNAGLFVQGLQGTVMENISFGAVESVQGNTLGEAAWLQVQDPTNPSPVVKALLPMTSGSNFLECVSFTQSPYSEQKKCHIDGNGTLVSGSDFAEALPARGAKTGFEPGDVLVMSADGSGVETTTEMYSARAVGVYSTRPAVLGAEKGGETRVDVNDLPVAIMGIVPTKVSAENGAIAVGDILVTSSTKGYAMKASDRARLTGTVIGKALQPLASGTGVIRVLVSVR